MTMISILIPVKNAAPFLAPCIFSILRQTETDWEAIFVDDHSTDTSFGIIQAIAKRFPKIKILKSNGNGIIPALQTAYANSAGNLITRMDADDIMPPNKLKILKDLLAQYGNGYVATGKVKYFSENELGQGYINYQNWLNQLATNQNHYKDLYKECVVPSAGFMIARNDLDKVGAFNSALYPEDYDLVFRFYAAGLKIIASNKVVHKWRDHRARTSRNNPIYKGHYFDLKLHYFLSLDYDSDYELVLIGAGDKGKSLAQKLINKNIPFAWQTNNPNKIGKDIYGVKIQAEKIGTFRTNQHQLIIAISAPLEVSALQKELVGAKMDMGVFWFC